MSSTKFDPGPTGRAEQKFREAFDRLLSGKPQLLPKGSRISQNNVAKEAGVDPSALRRVRFPKLVEEIQRWIEANESSQPSPRQQLLAQRSKARGLRDQLDALRTQRDDALSKLVTAEARIVSLTAENERLQALLPAKKVTSLRP